MQIGAVEQTPSTVVKPKGCARLKFFVLEAALKDIGSLLLVNVKSRTRNVSIEYGLDQSLRAARRPYSIATLMVNPS